MISLCAAHPKAQEWQARALVCNSGSTTNLPASLKEIALPPW